MVTSLKEYQKAVADIFNKSGIIVFSVTGTVGFKDHHTPNLLDEWFSAGNEKFDSIFLFSFTQDAKADQALDLVKKYNAEHNTGFPIHAFILPVDKSSQTEN
jgi:hypothetical protein